mgnify:CR=1 FL=1
MELYAPESFNNAKLLGIYNAGSPEWHAERSKGIGGSEVGTILGLNPYESAYALWAKKTGKIPSEIKENWAIRFGKAFEEPILKLWQEEHPDFDVYETGTYAHPHKKHLHANPDALAYNRRTEEWIVLEVKTARSTWDTVPMSYIAQVQHYLGVLGLKRGIIVAVAGMTWNEYRVEFDQSQFDAQVSAVDHFWYCMQEDKKPAWDGAESTYQAVRLINPEIIDGSMDLGDLGVELLDAQHAVDMAEARLNKAKSQAMDLMGRIKFGVIYENGTERQVASRQMRFGKPSLIIKKG